MALCRQKRAVASVMNKTGTETVHRVCSKHFINVRYPWNTRVEDINVFTTEACIHRKIGCKDKLIPKANTASYTTFSPIEKVTGEV